MHGLPSIRIKGYMPVIAVNGINLPEDGTIIACFDITSSSELDLRIYIPSSQKSGISYNIIASTVKKGRSKIYIKIPKCKADDQLQFRLFDQKENSDYLLHTLEVRATS